MKHNDEWHQVEGCDHVQALHEPDNGRNWYNGRAIMALYNVDNTVYVTLFRETSDGPSPIFSHEVGVYYSPDEAKGVAINHANKTITNDAVMKRFEDLLYGTDVDTFAQYLIARLGTSGPAERLAA